MDLIVQIAAWIQIVGATTTTLVLLFMGTDYEWYTKLATVVRVVCVVLIVGRVLCLW